MSAEGESPALIFDHPHTTFKPVHLAWGLCEFGDCRLAAAAHAGALAIYEPPAVLTYRCPDCVTARDFRKAMQHLPGECPREESA